MSHERENQTAPSRANDPLVAYLDGELDAGSRQVLEKQLADDPALLRRLHQHERAWELLDELPSTEVGETFTQSTVEMIAVAAVQEAEAGAEDVSRRRAVVWLGTGVGIAAVAVIGYLLATAYFAAPNQQLVEDLPVIEHLDAYRHAESIEFLQALESEGLFAIEVEDGL